LTASGDAIDMPSTILIERAGNSGVYCRLSRASRKNAIDTGQIRIRIAHPANKPAQFLCAAQELSESKFKK
jgi:hypothetical protein